MEQYRVRKKVNFEPNARKEYFDLPVAVRHEFLELIRKLEIYGRLFPPEGRKLKGTNLFEIRVRMEGAWRGLYAYMTLNTVLILSFFSKKTQKTPKAELKKALKRLKYY